MTVEMTEAQLDMWGNDPTEKSWDIVESMTEEDWFKDTARLGWSPEKAFPLDEAKRKRFAVWLADNDGGSSKTSQSKPIEIVAVRGTNTFLLTRDKGENGIVFDMDANKVFPPMYFQSILARGYWDKYEGTPEQTEKILSAFNALDGK